MDVKGFNIKILIQLTKDTTACLQSYKFACVYIVVTGNYLNLSVHLFRVVGGLDTLDKMEKVKTDDKDRPLVRSSFVVTIT